MRWWNEMGVGGGGRGGEGQVRPMKTVTCEAPKLTTIKGWSELRPDVAEEDPFVKPIALERQKGSCFRLLQPRTCFRARKLPENR
jgi:hypothetical protein